MRDRKPKDRRTPVLRRGAAVALACAAALSVTSCAPSGTTSDAVRGGRSPSDVAIRYTRAEIEDDEKMQDRLTAPRRSDCPRRASGVSMEAVVYRSPGEKLVPHVSRSGGRWLVTVNAADGSTVSSEDPLTVIVFHRRYFVC